MTGEIHSRKDWIIIHCERASSVKTEFLWHFKNVELQELSLKLISKTAILWEDQVSYVEKLWDSYPPFSSVQLLSHVRLFVTLRTAACQAPLSITNSWRFLKLISIKSVMPSNHLILCRPLLLLSSIFPSITVFSDESVHCIRWPKYWSFSFSISEYSGLISFRMDWFDLLAV